MLDVVLVDVLHAKVVDDECETDGAPVVSPVPWRDLALSIPGFVELHGEEVLRYDAGLGEAVHPVSHFAEDIAICVHLVAESVFVNDIRQEQLQFHMEVFVSIHWCHEVAIFYVNCHELALCVEMTLLNIILTVRRLAVGVLQSSGQLIRFLPIVIRVW
jgi:hypothetical protein